MAEWWALGGNARLVASPSATSFGSAQDKLRIGPVEPTAGVVYGLFEPVDEEEQALLEGEARRLEGFLGGEFLPPRIHMSFTRALK